jgi:hypothetical protein
MEIEMTGFEALWQQVEAIPHPGDAPKPKGRFVALSLRARFVRALLATRGFALCFAWIVGALLVVPQLLTSQPVDVRLAIASWIVFAVFCAQLIPTEISEFKNPFREAERKWNSREHNWKTEAGPGRFERMWSELLEHRKRWDSLPDIRQRRFKNLEERHRSLQLQRILSQFAVDETKAYRVAALSNVDLHKFGIRTAADVTRECLRSIPGIGYYIDDELLQWRRSLEEQFKPDPGQTIDVSEYMKIDKDIEAEGWELEFILKKELPRFRQISEDIQSTRRTDMEEVEDSYYAYLQARAELIALVGGSATSKEKRSDLGADRRSIIMRCSDLLRSGLPSVLRL